jgi:hypothetical protein
MSLFFFIWIVCLSTTAKADAGIPLLVFIEPFLLFSLLFVIFIEIYIIRKTLNSNLKETIKAVSLSNLVSTLVGVPLTWVILLVGEIFLLLSSALVFNSSLKAQTYIIALAPAWLFPHTKWGFQEKAITLWAILYLMIVFYGVSAWIETKINRRLLKRYNPLLIKKLTWEANLYSYLFLFLVIIWYWLSANKFGFSFLVNKIMNVSLSFFLSIIFPSLS